MRFILLIFTILTLWSIETYGQSAPRYLSEDAEVSLLTCSPADELHALFGHSAIYVDDKTNGYQAVFNYGTFASFEDDFYYKFARGKLEYSLSISGFHGGFMRLYGQIENRLIEKQVLNLTSDERQRLYEHLVETYIDEEKRFYKYDFFYDNCATRIWQDLREVLGDKLAFHEHEDAGEYSHRQIINDFLVAKPWAHWGIDLILGSRIDDPANNYELMFLPKYMKEIFEHSTITDENGTRNLVSNSSVIRDSNIKVERTTPLLLTPTYVFWGLFVILVFLGYSRFHKLNDVLDIVFFEFIGLLGVLVFLMWFYTDHEATKANFNLIWANPIHAIIPLFLLFKLIKPKMEKIFLGLAIFYFTLFLFWIAIPQELHPAFRPLILLLAFRYFFRFRRMKVARLYRRYS